MTIFWNCEGVRLIDFLPYGTTINGPCYVLFLHRLYASILEKRCGKLRRGMLLLHDNAPVHKFNITHVTIYVGGVSTISVKECHSKDRNQCSTYNSMKSIELYLENWL